MLLAVSQSVRSLLRSLLDTVAQSRSPERDTGIILRILDSGPRRKEVGGADSPRLAHWSTSCYD
jgi:hypothetical protein